jgi:hypothetical protein
MITVDKLAHDFRVFADPATAFQATEQSNVIRIQMIREGTSRDYVVSVSSGDVTAKHLEPRKYSSIQALLASDEFADVRSLRATQRRLLEQRSVGHLIEPEGRLTKINGAEDKLTLSSFRKAISLASTNSLNIVLLDGPAGIGKTSLLERMVVERTDPGSAMPPLLLVSSSGSRLTDLNKALAHATQVLRSRITFDQVPILVRMGVLQVAIDGFDELVDPEGYKDAWSALREFLGQVSLGGPVILSGRDTFFDQQSFEKKLSDRIPNLSLTSARLQPVSPSTAKEFLRKQAWSENDIASAESGGWLRPGSYHLRPFFLTQIGTTNGWAELRDAFGSPQAFLVRRFVVREANLVNRMVGLHPDRAEEALWDFYGLIVEDMASQEVDTVDVGFLALACETAFGSFVRDEDLAKLVHKAGSFGLLESQLEGKNRRFPHSELQNQFLARVVLASLLSSNPVTVFLRRGIVGTGLIEAFTDAFNAMHVEEAKRVLAKLKRTLDEERLADRLTANSVALLLGTLGRGDTATTIELNALATNEVRLIGSLEKANLSDVTISHLDARGADCHLVDFRNCTVGVLTANDETLFGFNRPTVATNLQIELNGSVLLERTPQGINNWINAHTIDLEKDEGVRDLPLVRYFERLCRKFIRQHQIRANDEDEAYFLLKDPLWEEVKPLLGDRLIVDTRSASGPRNVFFRLLQPEALLGTQGSDPESKRIRSAVIRRAIELG